MDSSHPTPKQNGIWIIDAHGKTVYANDYMAEILGTTASDLVGKDSFLYVFPEDLPAAERLFASKQAGSAAPFRFRLRRVDSSNVWVDVQGTPMHDVAGQFTGIVGTFALATGQDS